MDEAPDNVTQILEAVGNGDELVSERLLPVVYDALRRLATARMASEAPGNTLQPTALVHEAWLQLVGPNPVHWNSRGHFFGAAAEAMRRILLQRARKKGRLRRGGDLQRVHLGEVTLATHDQDDVILAIDEALEKLELESPQKAQIVKLRYFGGLGHAEIAEVLGVSEPTVRRHWAYARSWLYAELRPQMRK